MSIAEKLYELALNQLSHDNYLCKFNAIVLMNLSIFCYMIIAFAGEVWISIGKIMVMWIKAKHSWLMFLVSQKEKGNLLASGYLYAYAWIGVSIDFVVILTKMAFWKFMLGVAHLVVYTIAMCSNGRNK